MSDIKVPRHSDHSKVEKALAIASTDGQWHKILTMGMSTAEQTARAYNVPGGQWELGYTHGADGQKPISHLWVRWIG